MVLAELGRIRYTWRNLVEVVDVTDIVDIMVEIGRQSMAEDGRMWQDSVGHVSLLSSTAAFYRFPPNGLWSVE